MYYYKPSPPKYTGSRPAPYNPAFVKPARIPLGIRIPSGQPTTTPTPARTEVTLGGNQGPAKVATHEPILFGLKPAPPEPSRIEILTPTQEGPHDYPQNNQDSNPGLSSRELQFNENKVNEMPTVHLPPNPLEHVSATPSYGPGKNLPVYPFIFPERVTTTPSFYPGYNPGYPGPIPSALKDQPKEPETLNHESVNPTEAIRDNAEASTSANANNHKAADQKEKWEQEKKQLKEQRKVKNAMEKNELAKVHKHFRKLDKYLRNLEEDEKDDLNKRQEKRREDEGNEINKNTVKLKTLINEQSDRETKQFADLLKTQIEVRKEEYEELEMQQNDRFNQLKNTEERKKVERRDLEQRFAEGSFSGWPSQPDNKYGGEYGIYPKKNVPLPDPPLETVYEKQVSE